MDVNAVSLTGQLAAIEPLRHTPAGLPRLEFRLGHRSLQIEGGFKRQVECEVRCIALGETAIQLSHVAAETQVRLTGFLNRKNRMSTQLVLHATSYVIVREDNHGNDEQGGPGSGESKSEAEG